MLLTAVLIIRSFGIATSVYECVIGDNVNNDMCPTVTHLCWDHANLSRYYSQTGIGLQCILADIVSFEEKQFFVSHQRALSNKNW